MDIPKRPPGEVKGVQGVVKEAGVGEAGVRVAGVRVAGGGVARALVGEVAGLLRGVLGEVAACPGPGLLLLRLPGLEPALGRLDRRVEAARRAG